MHDNEKMKKKKHKDIKNPYFIKDEKYYYDLEARKSVNKKLNIFSKSTKDVENKILVIMKLKTGAWVSFSPKIENSTFLYNGGRYTISEEYLEYHSNSGLWFSFYHQDISIPISFSIKSDDIKKAIGKAGITDVDASISPKVLRDIINSDIISKVFSSVELEGIYKFIKLFVILNFVATVIILLFLLQQSGILQRVS